MRPRPSSRSQMLNQRRRAEGAGGERERRKKERDEPAFVSHHGVRGEEKKGEEKWKTGREFALDWVKETKEKKKARKKRRGKFKRDTFIKKKMGRRVPAFGIAHGGQ